MEATSKKSPVKKIVLIAVLLTAGFSVSKKSISLLRMKQQTMRRLKPR